MLVDNCLRRKQPIDDRRKRPFDHLHPRFGERVRTVGECGLHRGLGLIPGGGARDQHCVGTGRRRRHRAWREDLVDKQQVDQVARKYAQRVKRRRGREDTLRRITIKARFEAVDATEAARP